MHVVFPAALDAVAHELDACPSRAWLAAASSHLDANAFPMRGCESAVVQALSERLRASDAEVEGPLEGFPVFAWETPDAVELGFSTLSPMVRRHLAASDEPGTLARSEGGWRRALALFRYGDQLRELRLSPRLRIPFRDYAGARDAMLDVLADLRSPLLARLAETACLAATVLAERALPGELPLLTSRNFLAFRGHLEARCAAAEPDAMAAALRRVEPLFHGEHGLGAASPDAVAEALAGDWRADMSAFVVPVEKEIAPALEGLVGLWLFTTPMARDRTLQRGWAELFESIAVGLRYCAAIGAAQGTPIDAEQAAAGFALGEHAVAWSEGGLPAFVLPAASHDRGPRMADLDMTLESIC
ncbi:MAG: hypothetical protein RIT45_3280 [Pseudomonadota bacterium]|jgi:hypothetical protein